MQEESPVSVGIWQLVLILLIVLIVFGSARLPKAMADVAKSLRNFRAGIANDEEHEKLLTSETLEPEIADDRGVAPVRPNRWRVGAP
jgi:sec-independent protein translocase protein TatA